MCKIGKRTLCVMAAISLLLAGCGSEAGTGSDGKVPEATADESGQTADTGTASQQTDTEESGLSTDREGSNQVTDTGEDDTDQNSASDTEETAGHGENGYQIENGMAQPVLQYQNFRSEDYSNEDSDILRFCVYVETDHDTDNDGMADLVKVFAQVPAAAVKGDYEAAVIYDPTPYSAGTSDNYDFRKTSYYYDTGFDYDLLYKDCEKREGADEISTMDLALTEDSYQWNYTVPATEATGYPAADQYDYYLVRGFAVIECCGIGTLGSEGYELCGYDLEAEAHKCVVEWLTGDRVAYSDTNGTNEVKADWCNQKVAMTGCSYGGTLPYEVATLGVEGLETIIPIAGISNWYNYTNSQGTTMDYDGKYMDYLASYNSGSLFLDDMWTVINPDYAAWLSQIAADQDEANGNYTDIWKISNYSDDYQNIKCSALIVQGLNDFNVMTRQADDMYQAFTKAGQNVKLVFHQDGHNFLDGIMVGDQVWQSIMNQWLCHYLLDVDNGIEDMAGVTYQSNVDGQFYTADSWRDFHYRKAEAQYEEDTTTVTAEGYQETAENYLNEKGESGKSFLDIDSDISNEFYVSIPDGQAASYELDLAEGETIYGVPTVHFTASPNVGNLTGLTITAVLVDVMEEDQSFSAYNTKGSLSATLPEKTLDYFDLDSGYDGCSIKEYVPSYTRAKAVSYGWMDLANPGGGENCSDYSQDTAIQAGESYDYTFYMLPTVYTLQPGHTLKLILTTYDALRCSLVDEDYYVDYGYTIDNTTLDVEIPTLKSEERQ